MSHRGILLPHSRQTEHEHVEERQHSVTNLTGAPEYLLQGKSLDVVLVLLAIKPHLGHLLLL